MLAKFHFAIRMAVLVGLYMRFTETSANAQSIGDNVVSYLNGAMNARVGGGESDHLATEALRIAGGEFVASDLGTDSPSAGDKVWGTLVTKIVCDNSGWFDYGSNNQCLQGDIIQFGGATFGNTIYPAQFTAIVATVNVGGRPSSVYQQNFGGNRVVQQASIDTTKLMSGWMCIYRPIQRIDHFNVWKFTAVNNSASSQSYQMMIGIDIDSAITLTAANTAGSFIVHAVTTIGTVPNFLLSDNTSFFVESPKGSEIYDSSNGFGIRQLQQ